MARRLASLLRSAFPRFSGDGDSGLFMLGGAAAVGLGVGLGVSQAHFSRSSDDDEKEEFHPESGWEVEIGRSRPIRRVLNVYERFPILSDEEELENASQFANSARSSASRAMDVAREAKLLLKSSEEEVERVQAAAAAAATAVRTSTKAALGALEAKNALENVLKLQISGADVTETALAVANDAVISTNKVAEAALKAQNDIGTMVSKAVQNASVLTPLEEECRTHSMRAERMADRIRAKVYDHGNCKEGPAGIALEAERCITAVQMAEEAATQCLSRMKTHLR